MKTAVIILGHGSKTMGADDAIRRLAAEVKGLGVYSVVEHAFLQYVRPSFDDALENCIGQKAERVVIVPFFMQPGAHVSRDIPGLAEKARQRHPGVDIVVTDYVGSHPLMTKIVADLVEKTE